MLRESPDSDARHSLLYLGASAKAREFVDPIFQVLNLAAECVYLLVFSGRESVLQSLQPCLFHVPVDVGFPDVRPLVNVVDVLLVEVSHVKCVIDLVRVNAEYTIPIDTGVLQRSEDLFMCSYFSTNSSRKKSPIAARPC